MKKKLMPAVAGVCAMLLLPVPAHACTELYAGSERTEDGKVWFSRVEDYGADYSKKYFVNQAGAHKEGEEYDGCYGFHWTFTHDSYSYNGFMDDANPGSCTAEDTTHKKTPYQGAGTNEKGLTVTATETMYPSDKATEADPFTDTGIEEADITTVLLSEASTAREAVDILTGIFDEVGSNAAGSTLVADKDETWYIENLSGSQYVAVKLTDDMMIFVPNVAAVGRVDLDDTENVIASKQVIEKAKEAGTFVGDEAENIIDYGASYEASSPDPESTSMTRLVDGLNALNDEYAYTAENISPEDFAMTNLDEGNQIVAFHSKIATQAPVTRQDFFDLYDVPGVGKSANVETHIFSLDRETDSETSVEEWISMGNGRYSVFVPYYPMLTSDVFDAYKTSAAALPTVEEQPKDGVWFENEKEGGYSVYPENWADSYYWSFELLSHIGESNEADSDVIRDRLKDLQAEIEADWKDLEAKVAKAEDKEAVATEGSKALAEKAYQTAHELLAEFGYLDGAEQSTVNTKGIAGAAAAACLLFLAVVGIGARRYTRH